MSSCPNSLVDYLRYPDKNKNNIRDEERYETCNDNRGETRDVDRGSLLLRGECYTLQTIVSSLSLSASVLNWFLFPKIFKALFFSCAVICSQLLILDREPSLFTTSGPR